MTLKGYHSLYKQFFLLTNDNVLNMHITQNTHIIALKTFLKD